MNATLARHVADETVALALDLLTRDRCRPGDVEGVAGAMILVGVAFLEFANGRGRGAEMARAIAASFDAEFHDAA
jgi:hypothetical protein